MNCDFFKNKFLRKMLASWCAFATLVTTSAPAWAAVATGDYLGGAANLNGASSGVENYGTQTSTYAGFTAAGGTGVLDWNKLNVPGSTTMEFNNGTFYNVVNSAGGMSTIAGAISGTDAANVYIFNPNGVMFNSGSVVDVGGVFGALATGVSGAALTSWMANPTDVPAAIQNAMMTGDITVNGGTFSASQIALAGKNVSVADGAKFNNNVSLAAGTKVAIDGFGGGMITLTIPDAATEGDVDVLGEFAANLEIKAAGDTTVAGGTLKVGEKLTVASTDGDGVFRGGFDVNNATIEAKSADVDVAGDVWVQGKTDFKSTAGDVALKSRAGQVNVLGTAGGDTASIQATAGDLTITAAKGIAISEHGVITATKTATESKGYVILTANGQDDLSGDGIQVAGAGAKVSGDNGVTLTANDGNVTIKDGSEIASVTETKIQAMKGAISEDATSTLLSKGVTYLKAKPSENITLEGAANKLEGKVIIPSAAKDVKIVNDGDLTINQATAEALDLRVTDVDVMSVKATGSITAQKIVVQKSDGTANAVLEQSSGTITVTGTDGITAKMVKQTASSTIKTDKITGDFEQAETVRYATLSANTPANGLTITGDVKQNKAANSATATIGGTDQNVTIEGALTQTKGTLNADVLVLKGGANQGEQGKIAATSLDLQGAANDFTLLGAANAIKKIGTSLPAGVQNVQVKNATALEIGKTTASGNFIAETVDGAITVADAVTAGKDVKVMADAVMVSGVKVDAGGDLTIDAMGDAGAVTIQNNATVASKGALTIDAKTDVMLDAAVVEGQAEVTITAHDGKIEQMGDGHVTVGGVATLKAAGDITLANADNDFVGTVSAEGVNVLLTDKNNIKLGTVLAQNGELNVMALNGSIKQTSDGKVTVGKEANLTAEGGDVNLQNWRNDFQGGVNATAKDGNVRIRDGVDDVLVGTVVAKKNAVIQSNVEGGKVIADGETSMTANSVSLNSQLGDVSVTGGATLTGETDVSLTAGNDVTVGGAGTTLAGKEITVYTEDRDVVIEDEATLMADKAVYLTAANDLTISKDAVVMARGKGLEAGEKALTFEALGGSITVNDTTGANETLVTAKGDIEMTAKKDIVVKGGEETGNVQIESYGTLAARAETGKIEIHNAQVWASKDLALTADRGDVTVDGSASIALGQDFKISATEGAVTVADLVQVGAGRDVIVMAKNDVSVQDRANVFASRSLSADATAGELTIGEAAKVGAQSNMRLAAGDDTTINSAVAAGKNLTVIGKNVRQNADFTAQDGSVYVEATGGDIVMASGTKTVAGKKVAGSTDGTGNILYTATGDVKAEAGGATLVADPDHNDGAIVLSSEKGNIGENMTLKAARVGAAAKGDIKTYLVGDVTFGVTSLEGSITLDHEAGTLTVDKSLIGANDKAVKVLSATETELIDMKGKGGEGRGLDAATFVNVTGHDGSTVVVDSEAGIFAKNGDATVTVDRDIRVDGTVDASADALLTAGNDVTVNGFVTAGDDVRVTAGDDVAVNGAATAGRNLSLAVRRNAAVNGRAFARNGLVMTAGRDAAVSGTASAGHDLTMTAGRDATVSGTVTAGNNANLVGERYVTVAGQVRSDKDSVLKAEQDVTVSGKVSAHNDARIFAGRDVDVSGSVAADHDLVASEGRDVDVSGDVVVGRFGRVTADRNMTVRGTLQAGQDLDVTTRGNLATPDFGKLVAGRDLSVTIGSSTPQINVAVGKGISARSGERVIAFKTLGGYAYPEVYGNDSKTAVFIDGRVAGGNSADFSILQGYEQAAAFGNAFLMPVFTRAANFFPLTCETDMQAPEAVFTQGYLFSSEKGEIMEEADEEESPELSVNESQESAVQTASL